MADLEPKLLRAFAAIVETGGVAAAARREGVSQPTMSGHLRRLREHFADPLFVRRAGALLLTAKAKENLVRVQAAIRALDALSPREERWSESASPRRFRLVASEYVQSLLVPRLDLALRSAPGPACLDVASTLGDAPLDWDVVVAPAATLAPDLRSRHAFAEHLVALLASELLDPCGSLSLDLFCALDHVLVAPAPSPPHAAVDRALAAAGRGRRVTLVVSSAADLSPLLQGRRRLAMLPARAAERYRGALAIARPPVALNPVRFRLAWRREGEFDARARWFQHQVALACQAASREQS